MSRATLFIGSETKRAVALDWLERAPLGFTVNFLRSKRTTPQNDRMWAMLTEVSRQVEWFGKRLPPEDWKTLFMDALNKEVRAVPNLDGTGFVDLGRSTSRLTKDEHADLTMLIEAFAAKHNVDLREPVPA